MVEYFFLQARTCLGNRACSTLMNEQEHHIISNKTSDDALTSQFCEQLLCFLPDILATIRGELVIRCKNMLPPASYNTYRRLNNYKICAFWTIDSVCDT